MSYDFHPEPGREQFARNGGVAVEVPAWQLLAAIDVEVPQVFEEAFAVAALVNPKATIVKVEPLSIKPGDRIDLAVTYTASNESTAFWQTVVVVKEGAAVLVQERQKHTSKSVSRTADCDTGRVMPETPVSLTVEVWAHDDYWTTSWPY